MCCTSGSRQLLLLTRIGLQKKIFKKVEAEYRTVRSFPMEYLEKNIRKFRKSDKTMTKFQRGAFILTFR